MRRRASRELQRRISRLASKIWKLLYIEDAFGLKPNNLLRNEEVSNTRWKFLTSEKQVEAFGRWIQTQVDEELLDMSKPASERYWDAYIQQGFKKGAGRAFDDTRKPGKYGRDMKKLVHYEGTKDEFMRSAFAQPETVTKLRLLVARNFSELDGLSKRTGNQLQRILADGLVRGEGPAAIARRMRDSLGTTRRQAETIARTELTRAHAEGQLTAMEELGVEEIGVMVEWSTAGDDRVCPACSSLEGVVLKIQEAKGLIPRHPNCRCAFIPANVGESKKEQVRTKSKIEAAIQRSARRERPSDPDTTPWAGVDASISKSRPKPLASPGGRTAYSQFTRKDLEKAARAAGFTPSSEATDKELIAGIKYRGGELPSTKPTTPVNPTVDKQAKQKIREINDKAFDTLTKYHKDTTPNLEGMTDPKLAQGVVSHLEKLQKKYRAPLGGVHLDKLPTNVSASATSYGGKTSSIRLNNKYWKSEADIKAIIAKAKRTHRTYNVGSTWQDVVSHEFGHVLDFSRGNSLTSAKLFESHFENLHKVSLYAKTSADEAVAELFVVYQKGGVQALKNIKGADFSAYGTYFKRFEKRTTKKTVAKKALARVPAKKVKLSVKLDGPAKVKSFNAKTLKADDVKAALPRLTGVTDDVLDVFQFEHGDVFADVELSARAVSDGIVNIRVQTKERGFSALRTIKKGPDGELICHNDTFHVAPDLQGKGVGGRIFHSQVHELRKAGFARIETEAARDDEIGTIGYKVWPRLGYDGPLGSMVDQAKKSGFALSENSTLLDLLEQPGGREWWDKNGESISLSFDLSDGSRSMSIFNRYWERKAQ